MAALEIVVGSATVEIPKLQRGPVHRKTEPNPFTDVLVEYAKEGIPSKAARTFQVAETDVARAVRKLQQAAPVEATCRSTVGEPVDGKVTVTYWLIARIERPRKPVAEKADESAKS